MFQMVNIISIIFCLIPLIAFKISKPQDPINAHVTMMNIYAERIAWEHPFSHTAIRTTCP